jgi:predicted AAA+ superfamily ATPase
MITELSDLTNKIDRLLDRVESKLTGQTDAPDWNALAFRWRKPGVLQSIKHPQHFSLDDLLNVDKQKALLVQNTMQFLNGLPANNALLWGSRGTGKSSVIKGLLTEFSDQGLRLIEVDKADLIDLPDIVDPLYAREEQFIIFTDDLSFEAGDPSYKALKAMLDGSIAAAPENVLIYATSNRRHLMPEFMEENLEARHIGGEVHHGESVEEKVSLSDRFGLWVSFYPFKQEEYLNAVDHWLNRLGSGNIDDEAVREAALRWALQRGSRSGRVAYQFARDYVGRTGLGSANK